MDLISKSFSQPMILELSAEGGGGGVKAQLTKKL